MKKKPLPESYSIEEYKIKNNNLKFFNILVSKGLKRVKKRYFQIYQLLTPPRTPKICKKFLVLLINLIPYVIQIIKKPNLE